MGDLKYKVGDKVRIKSLDWYNENKDEYGYIDCGSRAFFTKMSDWCGKIATIKEICKTNCYRLEEYDFDWTDEMIEGLEERNGKTYPYKIGDRVVLKSNNKCATITDLRYNSQGNLSYFIKIDNDRDINISYPTDLLLPYDNMIEGELTMEETKTKFKVGDRVITDTNMKGKIIEVVEEGWYRVDFDDYNGISQPNGVVPEENMTIMTKETKPEPKFKVGDIIISDVFSTKDDKGWKVIDVERTGYKLISVNNSDLICDMDFKNEHYYYKLVEEEVFYDTDFEWLKHEILLPEGYIFKDKNGHLINTTKIVLEKKKKEYPKTYEECCEVLSIQSYYKLRYYTYEHGYNEYATSNKLCSLQDKLNILGKLIICRYTYWKIYGEEIGLEKPWQPDYKKERYVISRYIDEIVKGYRQAGLIEHFILEFPTEEMRDAFFNAFRDDIENCKELL